MTPAYHAALSAQLARALGWPYIGTDEHCVFVTDGDGSCGWFDYRDATIALPVLEWLMRNGIFMTRDPTFPDWVMVRGCPDETDRSYPSLCEAIARAAIAVMEGK